MESFIKLKLIRTENKLTQEQVASVLGITRSAYCGYEIGRRRMSTDMFETLAKFYRLPISVFFNNDGKTVNDDEHYSEGSMYLSSLSKEEREIILKYRSLDENGKSKLMNIIGNETDDGEK